MRFFAANKIVRVTLSLTVALWIAGAGCMLGCGDMTAVSATEQQSAIDSTVVVASDSCAASHGHDCCAKRAAKKAPEVAPNDASEAEAVAVESDGTPSSAMDCPLAVNATAALSKVQQQDDQNAVVTSEIHREILASVTEQSHALARPLRLPNRGHTYLRCCVFLI
jgi:hypothetical protein